MQITFSSNLTGVQSALQNKHKRPEPNPDPGATLKPSNADTVHFSGIAQSSLFVPVRRKDGVLIEAPPNSLPSSQMLDEVEAALDDIPNTFKTWFTEHDHTIVATRHSMGAYPEYLADAIPELLADSLDGIRKGRVQFPFQASPNISNDEAFDEAINFISQLQRYFNAFYVHKGAAGFVEHKQKKAVIPEYSLTKLPNLTNVPGTNNIFDLDWPITKHAGIPRTLRHEFAHGLDNIWGERHPVKGKAIPFSKTTVFQQAYQSDIQPMTPEDKFALDYYLKSRYAASEAFCDLFALLTSSDWRREDSMAVRRQRYILEQFPNTTRVVQELIDSVS